MKKYYLHISYQGQLDDNNIAIGDGLFCIKSYDLPAIREELKRTMKTKENPQITSLTVIPKRLFKILGGEQ